MPQKKKKNIEMITWVKQKMTDLNFDPVSVLVDIAKSHSTKDSDRVAACQTLLRYSAPTIRGFDLSKAAEDLEFDRDEYGMIISDDENIIGTDGTSELKDSITSIPQNSKPLSIFDDGYVETKETMLDDLTDTFLADPITEKPKIDNSSFKVRGQLLKFGEVDPEMAAHNAHGNYGSSEFDSDFISQDISVVSDLDKLVEKLNPPG